MLSSKLGDPECSTENRRANGVERGQFVKEFLILITLHETLNYYTTIFKVPLTVHDKKRTEIKSNFDFYLTAREAKATNYGLTWDIILLNP